MTYNEYTESRKNLITEANGLINEGKLDEANAKMEEVKALDEDMNEVEYEGEGLLARAFCHEIDHLDGHMYTELVEGELHQVSYDEDEE